VPAAFRKLDAVAVLTARLLPTPRAAPACELSAPQAAMPKSARTGPGVDLQRNRNAR
jgi:hypothetical protein